MIITFDAQFTFCFTIGCSTGMGCFTIWLRILKSTGKVCLDYSFKWKGQTLLKTIALESYPVGIGLLGEQPTETYGGEFEIILWSFILIVVFLCKLACGVWSVWTLQLTTVLWIYCAPIIVHLYYYYCIKYLRKSNIHALLNLKLHVHL